MVVYRKGLLSFETIIAIVIILIVLASVLLFVFRTNINSYLRQLPEFIAPDKEINVTKDVVTSSRLCEKIVGSVIDATSTLGYTKATLSLNGRLLPNFYWYIKYNTLQLDEWFNKDVGTVSSDFTIHIDSVWITNQQQRSEHPLIPSVDDLKLLDGAYFGPGNTICKRSTNG